MLKVLVNAYACSPNMGSEPGMAWNWCVHLANYCELFIITEEEFRDKIESVVPTLSQGKNMHFFFNPVTLEVRKMCWNQGDWRFYWYYRQWQKRTLEIARQICAEQRIDILHQLNMIGYREPGLLWKIKGPRFVWGPVGGMETMPIAYLKGAGTQTILFNRLKNLINSLQYRYQPNVRHAVKRADAIIAATSGCQKKLQDYYGKKVYLINETGCEVIEDVNKSNSYESEAMNLLWVGKMDFRKQIGLAIDVLGKLKDLNVVLHVCGGGTPEQVQQIRDQSKALGVEEKLNYHGMVSHDEVQRLMRTSDLFLFTSIMEGTPHVVQEAIANHLPVICIDTCGQGDCVAEECGVKVALSNREQTVSEMADAIRRLYGDRERLQKLSDGCLNASKMMSWDNKVKSMTEIYNSAPPRYRLDILWCGKFDFRKQLGLAIRIISELRDLNVVLHIVGSGEREKYQKLAEELSIDDKIVWYGQVAHEEVNYLMQRSDVFLFTSIMDATSTVVMEAVQNHLPVICFDTCGFGTVVDESIGVKIPLSNPDQSVCDFASALRLLYADKAWMKDLSDNCKERIKLFEWDYKAQMMVDIYNGVICDLH